MTERSCFSVVLNSIWTKLPQTVQCSEAFSGYKQSKIVPETSRYNSILRWQNLKYLFTKFVWNFEVWMTYFQFIFTRFIEFFDRGSWNVLPVFWQALALLCDGGIERQCLRRSGYSVAEDGAYGSQEADGTWNGVMNLTVGNKVEVGIGRYIFTQERMSAVYFLPPIVVTR